MTLGAVRAAGENLMSGGRTQSSYIVQEEGAQQLHYASILHDVNILRARRGLSD